MNMLTSLKTLLFSSASMKMPVSGDGTGMSFPAGEGDFAALLSDSMNGVALAAADVPPAPAGMMAENVVSYGNADPAFPPPAAPDIFVPLEEPVTTAASVVRMESGDVSIQAVTADAKVMRDHKPKGVVDHLPEQPVIIPPAAEGDVKDAAPLVSEEMADDSRPKKTKDVETLAPPAIVLTAPENAYSAPVDPHPSALNERKAAALAAAPGQEVRPAKKPKVTLPPQAAPAAQGEDRIANDAVPAVVMGGAKGLFPTGNKGIGSGKATTEEAASTLDGEAASASVPDSISPAAAAKLPRSEALSLLQMVREQFGRTTPETARVAETVVATPQNGTRDAKPVVMEIATPSVAGGDAGSAVALPTVAPIVTTNAPAAPIAAVPAAGLGAALDAQAVDMGVSGQWIDGLARDIAGLSQNGAHGRFQINAGQLGSVQVDIRQGADGAAVSLTVANEAAELALKQDSDRLRLDAGLAAVRISDVKIERAPHMMEASRPDGAGQSTTQQQSGQLSSSQSGASAGLGAGQGGGQGMAQSERQGHWQSRENIASGLKGSPERSVINQKDAGGSAGDPRRARYA